MSFFNKHVFNATNLTVSKREKLFQEKHLNDIRDECVEKRQRSLNNHEHLWKCAADSFRKNGIEVIFAENGDKVLEIVGSEIKSTDSIVKGKSLTTEEIDLRQYLEKKASNVVETDLGEWVIQQNRELPSHFTAPAIHLSSEDVSKMISKKFNCQISSDPESITAYVRKELRQVFLNADIGIIGANFILSDPAQIMTVSNEGNVSLSARLPEKLFVITGYDRIYDNENGIENMQRLLSSSATAQEYTSYIDFIKKPLPHQSITLIVLDNGRKAMMNSEFSDGSRCIRCAACLNICPVYQEVGGHTFGHVYHGGIGSLLTYFTGEKAIADDIASFCLRCSTCEAYCPMDIPVSDIVGRLSKDFSIPFYLKFPLKKLMHTVKKKDIEKQNHKRDLIFLGCAFRSPVLSKEKYSVLKIARLYYPDADVLSDGCCGMPQYFKGLLDESNDRLNSLKNASEQYNRLIIPCSSGYSFLKEKLGTKVVLMSQDIIEHIEIKTLSESIYYHLPCHLKNLSDTSEKETLSNKIHFETWNDEERCCGSGGTYFIQHPLLSKRILSRKEFKNKNNYKVITSCPSCLIQLRRIHGKNHVDHTISWISEHLL